MSPNSRLLNALTYPVIALGGAIILYWGYMIVVTWTGARAGDPVGIDEVASATTSAIKGVALGIVVVALAFVARMIFRQKLRTPQ